MIPRFEPGDTVTLKSGGQKMTVSEVKSVKGADGFIVTCIWFTSAGTKSVDKFPAKLLQLFEEPKPQPLPPVLLPYRPRLGDPDYLHSQSPNGPGQLHSDEWSVIQPDMNKEELILRRNRGVADPGQDLNYDGPEDPRDPLWGDPTPAPPDPEPSPSPTPTPSPTPAPRDPIPKPSHGPGEPIPDDDEFGANLIAERGLVRGAADAARGNSKLAKPKQRKPRPIAK